ncbi:MAG: protease complex subunit PrcB family protein [Patescibacteria group bacterium]|nr:protease complex subunit PrcB family protein [Patescibacteria group bacterium]
MRNRPVIIGLALLAIAIGVLVFLSGHDENVRDTAATAAENPSPASTAVSFTELAHGLHSSVLTRVNYSITSAAEFKELWKLTDATVALPAVDFKTHMVLAVFAGEKPSAGSAIAVSAIKDAGNRMVSVALTKPDATCKAVRPALSPYEIIAVPATTLPLTHEDLLTPVSCSK